MTSREESFSDRTNKGTTVSNAKREAYPLTIAASESETEVVDLKGAVPTAIHLVSGAWTAASIHLHVATEADPETFLPLKDAANGFIGVVPSTSGAAAFVLNPEQMAGFRFVKLRSANASTGAGVNQAAERELILVAQP
jgi:hypothetical protein